MHLSRLPYNILFILLFIVFIFSNSVSFSQSGKLEIHLEDNNGPELYSNCFFNVGTFYVNETYTIDITIFNASSTETLTIFSVDNLFPLANLDVNISGISFFPAFISPLSSKTLSITFKPKIPSNFVTSIMINSSDLSNAPFLLNLLVNGITAKVAESKLIINEVSNGPSGVKEFFEFVVIGTPGKCNDIRGWIFDDNSGRGSHCGGGFGIAPGHFRFSDHTQWSNIKSGAMIVVYNDLDPNPAMPDDDPFDDNPKDGVYVIPISNEELLTNYSDLPSTSACNDFNAGIIITPNDWFNLGLRNGGDLAQIVDPADLTTMYHSVAFGDIDNSGSQIYFPDPGSNKTFYFDNNQTDDPFDPINWAFSDADLGDTPGIGNSLNNIIWIESLNLQVLSCSNNSDCEVLLSTNSMADINQHSWDFESDGNYDETSVSNYIVHKYDAGGNYDVSIQINDGSCDYSSKSNIDVPDCALSINDQLTLDVFNESNSPIIKLSWSLNSPNPESNSNYSFVVEKSMDGKLFQSIATVVERQISNNIQFFDTCNNFSTQQFYYRIKCLTNNDIIYSNICKVNLNDLMPSTVQVFPNPIQNQLNIATSYGEMITSLKIQNLQNQTVYQFTPLQPLTFFSIDKNKYHLEKGIYILQIKTNKSRINKKVVLN